MRLYFRPLRFKMQPMANIALRAARKAADFILLSFDRPDQFQIEQKSPKDFVTNIDKIAEQIIVEQIETTYPQHNIHAEETGSRTIDKTNEYTWIIDPIDGTMNFIRGIPHFAVSIGIRKGNHLEHGVIIDPVNQEEYVASRGYGATLNGKKIRVTKTESLDETLIASGIASSSVNTRLDFYIGKLREFTAICQSVRSTGSAALDLAYVASGKTDGFWHPDLKPWDIAAGIVIVREAGGFVGDFMGGERFFESGDVVAANPKCFKAIVQKLSR